MPIDTLAVTVTRAPTALSRVPAAVSVVSKERIQAARIGLTLDEALNEVPGLVVNNRYNFALGTRISVRGLGARAAFGVRGVRLISDGIPLTMPDGQSNVNNIDLTSVERIEVLRGAASMLHGNAAGGVIDLSTETPAAGFAMEARGIAGNLGRGGFDDLARLNIKAGGGAQQLRYLLSAAHAKGSGARDYSRFEQTNLTARVEHFSANNARTALTLSFADAPVAENPGSLPLDSVRRNPRMAWPRNVATVSGEQSRQLQAGVQHRRRMGTATEFNVTAYGLTRTLDNPLPFAYIALDRKAGGVRSTFGTRRWLLGLDIDGQADDRAEFANNSGTRGAQRRDQTDRILTFGPFARITQPIARRLDMSAGVRYDRSRFEVDDHFLADGRDDSGSRSLSAVSPSVGVTFDMREGRTLFASLSTAFQTPTTTELINTPPAAGQPCCPAGLNDVEPEKTISLETGFRGRLSDRVTLDAAVYAMRVRDAIVPFQVAQVEGREFFRNAGRMRNRGFELSSTVALSQALSAVVSYTFSDMKLLDADTRLPGVPPHHAYVRATLRTAYIVVEPEAELTSAYYADDANSEAARNAAATVFNLRVRTVRAFLNGALEPFLILSNVTGERYNSSVVINAAGARYFEPAPGRSVFLGLKATKAFR